MNKRHLLYTPFFTFVLCLCINVFAEHASLTLNEMEDSIREFYLFAKRGKTSLLQSFMNTSEYLDDTLHNRESFMKTDKEYLGHQSFTYDMAIVSLVYILMGDYQQAARILDDFKDNFWVSKNGFFGLYNSYIIDQYDFFYVTPSGRRNLLVIGIDGSRIHTGPNLWVGLACQHFYMETGSTRYIKFMLDIFKWCRQMNHFDFRDGTKGGVSMGYGWGPPWQEIFCTEHNVDYYGFLNNIRNIYQLNDPEVTSVFEKEGVTSKILDEEIAGVLKWVKKVYRPDKGTFLRGINDLGEDHIEALDTTSWGVAALGPELMYELGIDPVKMVNKAEYLFQVNVKVNGKEFSGFDFTDIKGWQTKRKEPCIWYEGTGQMIVMYHVMANYFRDEGNAEKEKFYREKAFFFLNEMNRFDQAINLQFHALPYTSLNLQKTEVAFSFADWWPIARGKDGEWVSSLISTSWRYFAIRKFNALDLFTLRSAPEQISLELEESPVEEAE